MKGIASVVGVLLLTGQAMACDEDCNGPVHSTAAEACRLKAEANVLERVIADRFEGLRVQVGSDTQVGKMLAESQNAWLAYRDTQCQLAAQTQGGTHGISWHRCNAEMLRERDMLLQEMAVSVAPDS